MRSVRRIFALLVLAAWLPAMLHCDLEAAGFAFATECCTQAETTDLDHCTPGHCGVAEGEFTAPADTTVSAPVFCADLFSTLCVPEFAPVDLAEPLGLDESGTAPPELSRRWVFVSRAALSPRAPSLIS